MLELLEQLAAAKPVVKPFDCLMVGRVLWVQARDAADAIALAVTTPAAYVD